MPFLFIGTSSRALTRSATHAHPVWEITLNIEGEGTSLIGQHEVAFDVGSIEIIAPHVPHTKRAHTCFKDIYIQVDELSPVLRSVATQGFTTLTCNESDGIFHLMKMALFRYHNAKREDHTLGVMIELIMQLLAEKCTALPQDAVLEDLRQQLTLHFNDLDFSLDRLLTATGYNKDHIRRRFIAAYGITPVAYITELRIENAKNLLSRQKESGLSVAEIGAACGYFDEHYFSRIFKKQTGQTPGCFAGTCKKRSEQ